MPLFQASVLKKYLAEQHTEIIQQQYALHKNYFFNPSIQKNIVASKEEEFQEGFLRELFVKILGYTVNPDADYNLKTEFKNVKDSKKADGAIVNEEKVLAIIELKGTDTVNLNQVEIQAFGYKNNQENCRYVVTSNFQKLRFYIDNAIEFLEWDLFKLDYESFRLLYLCLSKENIFKNLPAVIKTESITVEENVTKQLYKEYSGFRKTLFNNIVELNPRVDKLLLFKKTQKLLDRFLFLFFLEDRMLVPPNSVRMILQQWNSLKDLDAYQPLYNRFKLYFGYLNTGHKGKLHDIFAYNGGLFAADDVLDNIIIDDTILHEATLSLSNYDYNSEVDVNILGHIFEHSLTEIEELENEITNNEAANNKNTKRKKDGVFYTPKYITKYIVENTVGTLCKNKKAELNIEDADYHPLQKKKTLKILLSNLHIYRDWLLQITIIDPACGSGAFLNQALEFLIAEHKLISELEANITGSSIVFDVENSILENNLFGVDINEESVEIAKLSLWLRTARKGRKLNSLNNNIKCGNSLINDATVAGDKAFIWEKEFPQIFGEYVEPASNDSIKQKTTNTNIETEIASYTFAAYNENENTNYSKEKITNRDESIVNTDLNILNEPAAQDYTMKKIKGGFDVVIGNPPYGAKISNNEKIFFKDNYITLFPNYDTYGLFFEKAYFLLKENGKIGFITPNTFLVIESGIVLRRLLFESFTLNILFETFHVFADAVVEPITTILTKKLPSINDDFNCLLLPRENKISTIDFTKCIEITFNHLDLLEREDLIFNYRATLYNRSLAKKIILNSIPLKQVSKISAGVKPYENGKGIPAQTQETLLTKPFTGFKRQNENWLKLIRGTQVNRYLLEWDNEYILYGDNLAAPRNKDNFLNPKIFIRRTDDKILAVLDNENIIGLNSIHCLQITKNEIEIKFILAILNSKLINWYFQFQNFHMVDKPLAEVKIIFIERLPIVIPNTQQPFIDKANFMLSKNKELQEATYKFIKLLSAKFETLNINTKLNKWYNLSFADFSKELSKQKIKLSLQQESEWLSFFELERQKALAIKNEIDITDAEIDKMVYTLYDLNEEEIKIVEGN